MMHGDNIANEQQETHKLSLIGSVSVRCICSVILNWARTKNLRNKQHRRKILRLSFSVHNAQMQDTIKHLVQKCTKLWESPHGIIEVFIVYLAA